jgi:hypothetical protein
VADAELAGAIDALDVAQLARERNPKIDIIYTAEVPHRVPFSRMVPAAPCIRSPYAPQQIAAVISSLGRRIPAEAA